MEVTVHDVREDPRWCAGSSMVLAHVSIYSWKFLCYPSICQMQSMWARLSSSQQWGPWPEIALVSPPVLRTSAGVLPGVGCDHRTDVEQQWSISAEVSFVKSAFRGRNFNRLHFHLWIAKGLMSNGCILGSYACTIFLKSCTDYWLRLAWLLIFAHHL